MKLRCLVCFWADPPIPTCAACRGTGWMLEPKRKLKWHRGEGDPKPVTEVERIARAKRQCEARARRKKMKVVR